MHYNEISISYLDLTDISFNILSHSVTLVLLKGLKDYSAFIYTVFNPILASMELRLHSIWIQVEQKVVERN